MINDTTVYLSRKILVVLLAMSFPLLSYGQWSAPVDLSPNAVSAGLNESMGTCIGVRGDTIHVVWTDELSKTTAALYYTRSVDTGLTWSTPVAITGLSGNAWSPTIAVSGANVHVAWREINPANNRRASYYKHSLDGGNTWSSSTFLDSTADWPAIAVSGDTVYIANDVVVSESPYNTEIFFLRSSDNGATWSTPKQLTFAVGRSEDEAILAQGSHVHMSWNDNRSGQFQIFYKQSANYGATWDSDVVVMPQRDYGTMVYVDGAHVDVVATGHPTSSHYQLLLVQSSDTGNTWGNDKDISGNDTTHTYFYPDMVRNSSDLHVVCGSSTGNKYYHSGDGGSTWDAPFTYNGGFTFTAYTGCVVHIICADSSHIHYLRNPTANNGSDCDKATAIKQVTDNKYLLEIYPNPTSGTTTISSSKNIDNIKVFDLLGQLVYEATPKQTQFIFELKETGMYFVIVTTGDETETKKIVVVR